MTDSAPDLTPREFDVMAVLWRAESASVADVRAALDDDLAYTSVLTVLQGLERKGHVAHERAGRKYLYRPVTSSRDAGGPLLDRILESLYRRSPARLVAHLVEDRDVSEADLREIQRLIDARLDAADARDPVEEGEDDA